MKPYPTDLFCITQKLRDAGQLPKRLTRSEEAMMTARNKLEKNLTERVISYYFCAVTILDTHFGTKNRDVWDPYVGAEGAQS